MVNMQHINVFLLEFFGTGALIFIALFSSGNPISMGVTVTVLMLLSTSLNLQASYNPAFALTRLVLKQVTSESLLPTILCEILGALVAIEFYKRIR
jgi:glycerol uptake facilitator-like aquaporin